MFSSKLRSWMENHIGRPRKKSSKNKNSLSNAAVSGSGVSDPKKAAGSGGGFNVYHSNGLSRSRNKSPAAVSNNHGSMAGSSSSTTGGCSSVLSSPARRREVSPIQTHTPSRYGWQSPDHDVVTSPKSDNYLHASPQIKSPRTQDTHRQGQFVNETTSTLYPKDVAPKVQQQQQQQQKQQQQQHKQQLKPHSREPLPPTKDCSSSSMSSLSWSTGSKEPIQIKVHHVNDVPHNINSHGHGNSNSNDTTDNAVHYEEIYTILRNPAHTVRDEQQKAKELARPKSDQLTHLMSDGGVGGQYCNRSPHFENFDIRQQNDNSKHYGKLLPSRITNASTLSGSAHGSAENLQYFPSNRMLSTHRTSYPLENGTGTVPHSLMTRYKNNSMPTVQAGNAATAAAAAPMHSLSSPESAYSSYSDGTSPGTSGASASSANMCQYTPPEYYINMRTGVHYFPKNANSLAIESHRYKISLNKIEEMSPIDPLPKTSFSGLMEGMPMPGSQVFLKTTTSSAANDQSMNYYPVTRPPLVTIDPQSPRMLRHNMLMPNNSDFEYKLHTSPSPRQRSRIRTNPWYCTTDAALPTAMQLQAATNSDQSKSDATRSSITCSSSSDVPFDLDTTLVSSSYLDSSHFEAMIPFQNSDIRNNNNNNNNSNHKNSYACTLSEEETSSSTTEVENFKNTVKRKHHHQLHQQNLYSKIASKLRHHQTQMQQDTSVCETNSVSHEVPPSDDDATLNEMMGKFDESYVYEKETDILSSDSDPTNCPSDLDTGQDAGDECDTDELLDIDFIDTSSIQEVHDRKDPTRNAGNCSYHNHNHSTNVANNNCNAWNERDFRVMSPVLQQFLKRSHRKIAVAGGVAAGNCRRKRFMKTRKKSVETRDQLNSPARKSRETRSVGGTPICLRKKHSTESKRYKTTPLSNRSSSLVFTDHMPREQYRLTVAESEKALIKADLEADVKYRQLILEAESILVSLKSSVQSIPRDTPIVSPRRINPLSNKRVEMLKNSEAVEPKRDLHKQQQIEQELVASLHKRIELLKYESSSAPNSPKLCRLSPRKTHLTNFIQQNISTDSLPRKSSLTKPSQPAQGIVKKVSSPLTHRRVRSHSSRMSSIAAKLAIDSDSDPECHTHSHNSKSETKLRKHHRAHSHSNGHSVNRCIDDYSSGSNSIENFAHQLNSHGSDRDLRHLNHMGSTSVLVPPRPFNLVDFDDATAYCPQSEPLKRKVYKNTFNFGHVKPGVDMESEIPKQALLSKIHLLRRERYAQFNANANASVNVNATKLAFKSSGLQLNYNEKNDSSSARNSTNCINKKQLILNTIADLKRNLEEQSVELNGLNDN